MYFSNYFFTKKIPCLGLFEADKKWRGIFSVKKPGEKTHIKNTETSQSLVIQMPNLAMAQLRINSRRHLMGSMIKLSVG